jgi:hypothetical protein
MATQTHSRKLPPAPPPGKKRRRGKRTERRAQVDLDVQNVDSSPESVEKRRESQSSPGAPGVPVVVPAEGSDKQSTAAEDDEPGGFEIIWAVEDTMVLDVADDEEARHVHVDRLWQLAAEMDLVDDEPARQRDIRCR